MSKGSKQPTRLRLGGRTWTITEELNKGQVQKVTIDRSELSVRILEEPTMDRPSLVASINGQVLTASLGPADDQGRYVAKLNSKILTFTIDRSNFVTTTRVNDLTLGPVLVYAPMSGRVVALNTAATQNVNAGQSLAVLEAMKMQNDISAPKTGTVKEIYVEQGALVKAGDKLLLLE